MIALTPKLPKDVAVSRLSPLKRGSPRRDPGSLRRGGSGTRLRTNADPFPSLRSDLLTADGRPNPYPTVLVLVVYGDSYVAAGSERNCKIISLADANPNDRLTTHRPRNLEGVACPHNSDLARVFCSVPRIGAVHFVYAYWITKRLTAAHS